MKVTFLALALFLSDIVFAQECSCLGLNGECLDNNEEWAFACKAPKIAMIGTIVILGVAFLAYVVDMALYIPSKIEVTE